MPIRRLEDTFTGTSATIGADELTSTALASVEHVKPHIQPGVLYPAVANIMMDGSTALSAVTTGPNSSTVASSKYGTVQSDGRMYYYTDIKGSKPIKDPRIGAHFGSQRHTFSSAQLLEQETATHGSNVYSVDGRDWCRFVDSGSNNFDHVSPQSAGQYFYAGGTTNADFTSYIEFTGYFNAVNWNTNPRSDSRVNLSIDGVITSDFDGGQTTVSSSPLQGRFVSNGGLVSLVFSSTPTLGIHTVRIGTDAASKAIRTYGIELITQDTTSATTKLQIQIPSQNVVSYGKKFTVSGTPHYDPFNGFTNSTSLHSAFVDTATSLGLSSAPGSSASWAISGSNNIRPYNGMRVVKWVDSSGTIKTSVTAMPPNAQNIAGNVLGTTEVTTPSATNATPTPIFSDDAIDHSLSEVAKTFHYREFGNGAANQGNDTSGTLQDFSMLSGSDNIAYVMDDGLTSLSGVDGSAAPDLLPHYQGSTKTWYLTFIGTGITLKTVNYAAGTYHIAQNLPYGTHILKGVRDADTTPDYTIDGIAMNDVTGATYASINEITFHQPKKPPIPEDAVVIADYMLMADFVPNATAGGQYISKGVRRCSSSRDHFYDNGSPSLALDPPNANGGIKVSQSSSSTTLIRNIGFGINFVRSTYGQTARSQSWYVNDTAHSSADAKTGVGGAWGSFADLDANITLGNNILDTYGVTADGNSVIHSATDIASPIHTSSHYQTFETPYLHELVGGDRNMEQNNLIVTADGKTWDEVTRDTSYIGNNCIIAQYSNTSITNNNTIVFDDWRGTKNGREFWHNKDFAIAHDRVICLVEGWYQIYAGTIRVANGAHGIIKINGAVLSQSHGQTEAHDTPATLAQTFLSRGDYVQICGQWYGNTDWTEYSITRI